MSQPDDRRLPVVVPTGREERREERRRRPRGEQGGWIREAHLFGQTGARRGLRGGRYAIDQAHSAYLSVEWSGSADRRRGKGGVFEDEI